MPDQDQDFRIKVSMDPSSATAGGDAIIAKQQQVKAQLEEATAASEKWGVSLETAQAALAQIRTEKLAQDVSGLRDKMEEGSAAAVQATADVIAKQQQLDAALQASTDLAQKWGVSIETAQAAMAKNTELKKAEDVNALALAMRNAATATEGFIGKLTASETAQMEAAQTAKQWGVSIDVARAALDRISAQQKATEINALTLAMRQASEAANDEAAANTVAAEAEEEHASAGEQLNETLRANQQKMMANAFYVHRLAEGFKDLSLGGRAASQGLMDISESLQYMLGPEMAIYAAVVQVVAMLVLLAEGHHRAGAAAKEHAEEEKDAKEAIDKTTQAIIDQADAAAKTHLEVLTQQLRDYLAAQQAIFDQQKTWDDNADKRLGYLQREQKATQDLALAQLEHQKQVDLNNATSAQQRAQIEADYKRRETAMKGGDTQQQNLAEQTLLSQQKQEDDAQRAQLLANNRDMDAKLQALKDDAAAKSTKAKDDGFAPDEAGSFKEQIKAQEDKVKAAAQAVADAQNITARDVLEGGDHLAAKRAQLASAQQNEIDQSRKLADLRDADTAQEALKSQGKELADAIHKNSDAIDKLVARLDEIYSKQRELSTESQTAATTTGNEEMAEDRDKKDLYYKQVDDNTKDLVKKNDDLKRVQKRDQKSETQAEELPLEQRANADRDKIAAVEEQLRQANETAHDTVATGRKHAGHTLEIMAAAKASGEALKKELDGYKADLAQVESALRDFKLQSKTNLQQ